MATKQGQVHKRVRNDRFCKKIVNLHGIFSLAFFILGLYTIIFTDISDMTSFEMFFVGSVMVIYVSVGVGILTCQQWAYYPFVLYLCILGLAFPIGTIATYYTFKKIGIKNIKGIIEAKENRKGGGCV